MQELQALWSVGNDIRGEVLIADYVLQSGCIESMKEFEPSGLLLLEVETQFHYHYLSNWWSNRPLAWSRTSVRSLTDL